MNLDLSVQLYFPGTDAPTSVAAAAGFEAELWDAQRWGDRFDRWFDRLDPDEYPAAAEYALSLQLTNDAEIQRLNREYRHKDSATDVLAFAAMETEVPGMAAIAAQLPLELGDIVISLDTAQRQAREQRHSLDTELTWLAAHGLLHLLGWDHPDDDSLAAMLQRQAYLLDAVGVRVSPEFLPARPATQDF